MRFPGLIFAVIITARQLTQSASTDVTDDLVEEGQALEKVAEEKHLEDLQPTQSDDCPVISPEAAKNNSGLCQQKQCSSNLDCPVDQRCCHNGCVFACTEASAPGIVLDWDTDEETIWGDLTLREIQAGYSRDPLELVAPPHSLIELEGGCLLTSEQYLAMEQFKKQNTVSKCYCDDSTVKCKLKVEQ